MPTEEQEKRLRALIREETASAVKEEVPIQVKSLLEEFFSDLSKVPPPPADGGADGGDGDAGEKPTFDLINYVRNFFAD
jgi:hypothetical protein